MRASARPRPRNRGWRKNIPSLPVIYEVEGDDTDAAYEHYDNGLRRSRRRARILVALSAAMVLQLWYSLHRSLASRMLLNSPLPSQWPSPLPPTSSPTSENKRGHRHDKSDQLTPARDIRKNSIRTGIEQQELDLSEISDTPLFYHISPGSTGSRTLYHATCKSGFPSVHHKSFCISQRRGIRGVSDGIVRGLRSHYELLRLYEMARKCCSLWSRGKIRTTINTNRTSLVSEHGGSENNTTKSRQTSETAQLLCNMPLREWTTSITTHLTRVLQSAIVGIFDTPYPYLAPQVLDIAAERRAFSPIIAMTERDPKDWATSRSKNHGIMVCREEYSFEGLGASEFDVLGCVSRASSDSSAIVVNNGTDRNTPTVLHFWDVFQIKSRQEDVDPAFQRGMERQMQHHQEMYLPLSQYAPDMFGTRHAKGKLAPMDAKDIAIDVCTHILGGEQSHANISDSKNLRSKWRNRYKKELTCRGRVDWDIINDTLNEYYHLPKTCEVPASKSGQAVDIKSTPMIPLIPIA